MRPLNTTELLQLWEYNLYHSMPDSSIVLLKTASAKNDADPSVFSIGERDYKLLQLREWMFGRKLLNIANCPSCDQKVEWENDVKDFKFQQDSEAEHLHRYELTTGNYTIGYRLPVSNDLVKINNRNTVEENVRSILQRSIIDAAKNDVSVTVYELPDKVLEAVEEQIELKDPQADIRISLSCPSCSYQWETNFDIQSYLWTEINAWAKNIVYEVYTLAKHFGWSEESILLMSPQRRQLYLQMIFS